MRSVPIRFVLIRVTAACAAGALLGACQSPPGPDEVPAGASAPSAAVPSRSAVPFARKTPTAPAPTAVSDARQEPRPSRNVRALVWATTIGDVSFTGAAGEFAEVLRLVRVRSGIPIIVTPAARKVIADEGLRLDFELKAPVRVGDLLNMMVGKSDALGWTVRHDVVQLTAKVEAAARNVLRTYDVRDLLFARTEFLPPVIRGIPSGEDFGEAPRSGGEAEEKVTFIDPDTLVQQIKLATDPGYWDVEGGGTIEVSESGYLLVTASPAMHGAIAGFVRGGR